MQILMSPIFQYPRSNEFTFWKIVFLELYACYFFRNIGIEPKLHCLYRYKGSKIGSMTGKLNYASEKLFWMILKNRRKTPAMDFSFREVACCNLTKERFHHTLFPVNFVKFFRKIILQNSFRQMFLSLLGLFETLPVLSKQIKISPIILQ